MLQGYEDILEELAKYGAPDDPCAEAVKATEWRAIAEPNARAEVMSHQGGTTRP